jgi:hypothetical protein
MGLFKTKDLSLKVYVNQKMVKLTACILLHSFIFVLKLQIILSLCFNVILSFILDCPGGELFNQLKKVRKMTEDQAKFYFL